MNELIQPLKAIWWLILEACSRRKTWQVRYNFEGSRYCGNIKAHSLEEAAGFCCLHGYTLEGRVRLSIGECALARFAPQIVHFLNSGFTVFRSNPS